MFASQSEWRTGAGAVVVRLDPECQGDQHHQVPCVVQVGEAVAQLGVYWSRPRPTWGSGPINARDAPFGVAALVSAVSRAAPHPPPGLTGYNRGAGRLQLLLLSHTYIVPWCTNTRVAVRV